MKVLLVVDEYSELIALENLLKKLGIVVVGTNKEVALTDSIMGFYPELVIVSQKGRNVDGMRLLPKIKKLSPASKIAFLYSPASLAQMSDEDRVKIDAFIELPIAPVQLLTIVANMGGLNREQLLEKYDKLQNAKIQDVNSKTKVTKAFGDDGRSNSNQMIQGSSAESTKNQKISGGTSKGPIIHSAIGLSSEREKRYQKALEGMLNEKVDRVLSHQKMKEYSAQLEKDSLAEREVLSDILEEKREFVRALFKKK